MSRRIGPASGTAACTFPPLANAHGAEETTQIGGSPPPRGTARRSGSKAFMTEASFMDHPRIPKPHVRAPEACIPQASTQSQNTTKLLQKCRKNNEWQQALEAKREEFARRMTECDARQAELKKRCKSLRKRVQQNEQGVQETRSKIDRATKKQEEERLLQQEKAMEIKQKKLQVSAEEEEFAKMIKDLERTNQYKQFLDVVCEENEGHFDEVDRILMRYESLFESQQQQSAKLLEHSDYVERRRDEFAKFCKSAGTEVVERNATIAQDRKTLDGLISETKELLVADEKIKQKQQKGIMELGEIEMAVDNLYTRCFIMDQELTKAQAQ